MVATMMKVKELIEKLKTYDEDSTIELLCTYDCGYATAGGDVTDICESDGHVTICCDEC